MPLNAGLDSLGRKDWIDFLRGLAISGVFFEHWLEGYEVSEGAFLEGITINLFYRMGMLVHLFFFLSGYGLTVSIRNNENQEKIPSWGDWIFRRFKKIAIPYWLAITSIFLISLLQQLLDINWGLPSVSPLDFFIFLVFAQNQFPSTQEINPAFWFIPVIVQLYLIYPLLYFLVSRFNRLVLLVFATLVSVTTILIWLNLGGSSDHGSSFFAFHILPFVFGICFAISNRSINEQVSALRLWQITSIVSIGITLIVISYWLSTFEFGKLFNDGITVLGVLFVLLPIYTSFKYAIPRTANLFLSVGRYSYTIYLIHFPIIQVIRKLEPMPFGNSPPALIAIGVGAILLLFTWAFAIQVDNLKRLVPLPQPAEPSK